VTEYLLLPLVERTVYVTHTHTHNLYTCVYVYWWSFIETKFFDSRFCWLFLWIALSLSLSLSVSVSVSVSVSHRSPRYVSILLVKLRSNNGVKTFWKLTKSQRRVFSVLIWFVWRLKTICFLWNEIEIFSLTKQTLKYAFSLSLPSLPSPSFLFSTFQCVSFCLIEYYFRVIDSLKRIFPLNRCLLPLHYHVINDRFLRSKTITLHPLPSRTRLLSKSNNMIHLLLSPLKTILSIFMIPSSSSWTIDPFEMNKEEELVFLISDW
jgi:hypothetical protein